jgi:hypothetical protein
MVPPSGDQDGDESNAFPRVRRALCEPSALITKMSSIA